MTTPQQGGYQQPTTMDEAVARGDEWRDLYVECVQDVKRAEAEVALLRELLVSAEGYAISSGADRPFVCMFVEGTPKAAAIERAGCYPRDARREHPGRYALNPPGNARSGEAE